MKRLFLFIAVAFIAISASAQGINGTKNAIGVRAGWGAEASYQRYVTSHNRVEATLGINRYGFNAGGVYQWMFDIPSGESGEFKWYAGVGASLGAWTAKKFEDGFSIGALGQVGIEYGFASIPLLISVDYRPGLYFAPKVDFDWSGFALGVRYCF